MVIDWLAAGVDPARATLFIQSQVPEHAELHLLLSMMTPLGWLERVPTYKDQQEKLENKDLSTYGFPRLSAAAVGRHPDLSRRQGAGRRGSGAAHRVFARDCASLQPSLRTRSRASRTRPEAVKKLGAKRARRYEELRTRLPAAGRQAAIERRTRCSTRCTTSRTSTASGSSAISKAPAR
jgi:tryptophanyl-tRNA synthetase